MNQPQIYRRNTAEWILTDSNQKQIGRSPEYITDIISEPIINDEGQTFAEWKSDLERREREESVGVLPTVFTYVFAGSLIAFFAGIAIVPVAVGWIVIRLLSSSAGLMSSPLSQAKYKPNINVNVDVEGDANVTVNVNVKN